MNVSGESIIFTGSWDHHAEMNLSLIPGKITKCFIDAWKCFFVYSCLFTLHTLPYVHPYHGFVIVIVCVVIIIIFWLLWLTFSTIVIIINDNWRHQALVQDLIPWEGVGVSLPILPDNHPVEGVSLFYHLSFIFQRRSWHVEPLHITFTRWLLCLGWHDVDKKQISGDYLSIFVVYTSQIIDCHSLTKSVKSLSNICSAHS